MAYPPKLADLVEALALVADRGDRIDLLISTADRFSEVPARIARRPFAEEHKVPACESEAYLWAEKLGDGTLKSIGGDDVGGAGRTGASAGSGRALRHGCTG